MPNNAKKPVTYITLNGVKINIRYATTAQLKASLGYQPSR